MEPKGLRNGSSEKELLVAVTMFTLKSLLEDKNPETAAGSAIAFYELVQKCEDPSHEIFASVTKVLLKERALLDASGAVHSSVRNIVLSAKRGEGLELYLGSPYAGAE
jgi:hypothetical protein